jgi:hypothetical protein
MNPEQREEPVYRDTQYPVRRGTNGSVGGTVQGVEGVQGFHDHV